MKNKIRPYILPAAILLGIVFHRWLNIVSGITPYLIFTILLLTFTSVDVRHLKPQKLDLWIILLQLLIGVGGYGLFLFLTHNEILAESILIGGLCPVAASVSVVACALGANRRTTVTYTILGNLMVALAAPVIFSYIGVQQNMPFYQSFGLILGRTASILAIPFFLTLVLQCWFKRINDIISRGREYAFYLWAMAFLLTLGKTMDFIFIHGKGNEKTIFLMGLMALILCILEFSVGKLIGRHYGDEIAGGQLLAQKNSAMGIWMASMYLHPLTSVILAFYSIWQNLFNSWQLWYYSKHPLPKVKEDYEKK